MPPLKLAFPAVLALWAGLAVPVLAASGPVVATDLGRVRGDVVDNVESWKGIPFAGAPTGALRWRAPQPALAWRGVLDANAYGHDCMQVPFPSDAAPLGTPPAEDCLYLNVWRPAGTRSKLPVIVWIYGGGFVNGGASPPTYSGASLARQGVVFVSFNYRVGRFGSFGHPQLTAADEDKGLLYNYGYLDQIAALRWTQRNIAAFGGDPANVTIVGESAGGMSVHALTTSPLATGLFQKAVIMSGGGGSAMGAETPAEVEKIGIAFAETKGIASGDPHALAKLRALSAEEVTSGLNMMALFRPSGPRTYASPPVDGRIAVDAGQAYRSGGFAHVPMIVGATSGDMGGRTGMMVGGARSIAATVAAQGVPVFEYRFSYVAESARDARAQGAGHASDIPFFLHTEAIKYGDKATPKDRQVGRTISAYLVEFAKTGDPNGPDLPGWPRYSASGDQLMDFAENGEALAEKDPWGAELDAARSTPVRP